MIWSWYRRYFPPGTYKITETIEFGPRQGGAILGHGGLTTLLWGGAKSNASAMFLCVRYDDMLRPLQCLVCP